MTWQQRDHGPHRRGVEVKLLGARALVDLHLAYGADTPESNPVTQQVREQRNHLRDRIRLRVEDELRHLQEFRDYADIHAEHAAATRRREQAEAKCKALEAQREVEKLSDAAGLAKRLLSLDKQLAAVRADVDQLQAEEQTLAPLVAERRRLAEAKVTALKAAAGAEERDTLAGQYDDLFTQLFGHGDLLTQFFVIAYLRRECLNLTTALPIDLASVELTPTDTDAQPADAEEDAAAEPATASA